jgi:Retrotransposon gag protein
LTNPEETQNPLSFSGLLFEPRPQGLSWNPFQQPNSPIASMDPNASFQSEEIAPLPPMLQIDPASEASQPPPGTPHYPPGTPLRPGTPAYPYHPYQEAEARYRQATAPVPVMTTAPHSSGKEIRINNPTEFDGNREHLNSFLQDCHLYLVLNHETYNEDDKKIIFVLSYMTKGTAKAWKEAFIQDIISGPTKSFGTYNDFLKNIEKSFAAADVEGDARAVLRQLRQGNGTVDDYISQFRILAGRAKITDETTLIEYFMEGLNVGILQKIFSQQTIPKKMNEWYEQSSKYDAQYRRIREILGRRRGTSSTTNTNQTKKTFVPRYTNNRETRDPNAMDVDKLTVEEREKHMKENRCFNCHKIGHRAKDCRSKKQGTSRQEEGSKPNDERAVVKYDGKKTANTTRALIRNLVADMEKEEKDKLFENMLEDQDF